LDNNIDYNRWYKGQEMKMLRTKCIKSILN